MFNDAVYEYRKRREKRLAARGYRTKLNEYRNTGSGKKVEEEEKTEDVKAESSDVRMDAPEEQQQNNRGEESGGHGNTRLPFGLCKRFGIEIQKGWTPSDAWAALAGKGITASDAYARLKKGEDPGVPTDGEGIELPKEPKKTFTSHGKEYSELTGKKLTWARSNPWKLEAVDESGGRFYRSFATKSDMFQYLKEKGVEEFKDPETGEMVNPLAMELPKAVLGTGAYPQKYYKGVTIGLRKGKYTVIGTGLEDKKETMREFSSLADAEKYLDESGVAVEDRKISPSVKKREKERLAWKDSDKKEFIEHDGIKYGDLKVISGGFGGYYITGSSEDGKAVSIRMESRAKAMQYLKEQGVEKVADERGGYKNPMEFEMPPIVATIGRKDYTKLSIAKVSDGFALYGEDVDGWKSVLVSPSYYSRHESYDAFLKRIYDKYDITEDKCEISDETREAIRESREEEALKEKRRAEFEEKAVRIGAYRYSDISIGTGSDGYFLAGYDKDGEKRIIQRMETFGGACKMAEEYGLDVDKIAGDRFADEVKQYRDFQKRFETESIDISGKKYVDLSVMKNPYGEKEYYVKGFDDAQEQESVTGWMDLYELTDFVERYGIDADKLIKDESIKKDYEYYQQLRKEFDAKAAEYDGKKYIDVKVVGRDDGYRVIGVDVRGRDRLIFSADDYDELNKEITGMGLATADLPMDDDAKETAAKEKKVKEALETGEYYKLPYRKEAYKDLRVVKDGKFYEIKGIDTDGEECVVKDILSYDEAISKMEDLGVPDYKIYDGDKVYNRPKDGMRKVIMMRTPDGFKIMATTGKSDEMSSVSSHEVHSEPTEAEARKWLRDNGVDDTRVRTKGMNPNDDVPRTHDMKSLATFDQHRADKEDDFRTLTDMDSETKQEVVDMLTDVFEQGAYRMRSKGHFEEVFDGHFKNLLETGTSGGSTSKPGRRITGQETFGHDYDIEPIEAEKYGYLGVEDDAEAFDSDVAKWYGSIVYKFKKDAVDSRVTYTAGDSLDAGRPLAGYAGTKPTYEGMSALYGDTVREVLDEYKKYKEGKVSFRDFYDYFSGCCEDGYVECHYHGMLTIDDVATVTFPEIKLKSTFDKMKPEKREKVLTGLKERGILLQYVDESNKLADGYEYIKKLYGI